MVTDYASATADILAWCAAYDGLPFHALLCDAPYELAFMSKSWDNTGVSFRPETWAALAEHLLPGALLFVFAGSRTYHRIACALEDAGLAIAQPISWLFGSGFPKATRIDTQIDAAAGAEREVVGKYPAPGSTNDRTSMGNGWQEEPDITAPATPLAQTWAGHRYGITALKPMCELICVAQKPYDGRSVDSITKHGSGAYAIDAGRMGTGESWGGNDGGDPDSRGIYGDGLNHVSSPSHPQGRWPGNVILDEDAAAALDEQAGERASGYCENASQSKGSWFIQDGPVGERGYKDSGPASRFFKNTHCAAETFERINAGYGGLYTGKAPRWERDAGVDKERVVTTDGREKPIDNAYNRGETLRIVNHPTVKPITLTHWLATLLLPPPEYAPRRLLVPFSGVSSEMIGAMLAGWDFVQGVELMPEYVAIAEQRMAFWRDFVDSDGDVSAILERGKRADKRQRQVRDSGQLSLFD